MAKIRELVKELHEERAIYHKNAAKYTTSQIAEATVNFKEILGEIAGVITDGAKKCPDCGNAPHGIFHDGTPKPFEIGCLTDANHRVRETLPEDAVERWNKDDYDQPREPGTLRTTLRDRTGEVIEEKTLKPIAPTRKR